MSLHLFLLSLISFIPVLQFSANRSFISLGKFIPRYFILSVAMVNRILSSISLTKKDEFESVELRKMNLEPVI